MIAGYVQLHVVRMMEQYSGRRIWSELRWCERAFSRRINHRLRLPLSFWLGTARLRTAFMGKLSNWHVSTCDSLMKMNPGIAGVKGFLSVSSLMRSVSILLIGQSFFPDPSESTSP